MTRPDDDPPREGESGHRARAYAAALLGELTGGRRSGGVDHGPEDRGGPQPQGPSAVPDLAASTLATESPADAESLPAGDGTPLATAPSDDGTDGGPDGSDGSTPQPGGGTAAASAPDLPRDEPSPAAGVQERPETAVPLTGTPVRPGAALTRTGTPGTEAPTTGARPAPFTYAEVAAHHSGPARARAQSALDAAGPQITARSDREQVRRAARTAVSAAALLDACDALDARAEAADRTWTGERHGTTEVGEFERAWSGFYDSAAALA